MTTKPPKTKTLAETPTKIRTLKTGASKPKDLRPRLPNSFKILKSAVEPIIRNYKLFGGMLLIFGIVSLLLSQSLSQIDTAQTKQVLNSVTNGTIDSAVSGVILFSYMAGSTGNSTNSTAGTYELFFTIFTSLALIWTLRQVYTGAKVRIRDGFYKGMYPLIPFLLVLIVVLVQLFPLLIGAFLYNYVGQGTSVTIIETVLSNIIFGLLAIISLYMLSSSLIALYIVCLPDMTPRVALRTARGLARGRRWSIVRKIIFLPFFLFVAGALTIVPILFVLPAIAPAVLVIASMFGLILIHSYMYRLYRDLI